MLTFDESRAFSRELYSPDGGDGGNPTPTQPNFTPPPPPPSTNYNNVPPQPPQQYAQPYGQVYQQQQQAPPPQQNQQFYTDYKAMRAQNDIMRTDLATATAEIERMKTEHADFVKTNEDKFTKLGEMETSLGLYTAHEYAQLEALHAALPEAVKEQFPTLDDYKADPLMGISIINRTADMFEKAKQRAIKDAGTGKGDWTGGAPNIHTDNNQIDRSKVVTTYDFQKLVRAQINKERSQK